VPPAFCRPRLLCSLVGPKVRLALRCAPTRRHYDWGLRAIKSVLVVAGSLLRAEAGQVRNAGMLVHASACIAWLT